MATEQCLLVGTIPRSGTNYVVYFLLFYEFFLFCEIVLKRPETTVEEAINIITNKFQMLSSFPHIGLKEALVGHAYCPGFSEVQDYAHMNEWMGIPDNPGWWNALGAQVEGKKDIFFPGRNPAARIVFLYRNPLDTMVSIHRHLEHHIDGKFRTSFESTIKKCLPQYAKSYVSYAESAKRFPENILMLPYEKLVSRPHKIFSDILSFCRCPVSDHRQAFSKALQAAQPEVLRTIELKLGRTLAGDQYVDPTKESHMRGGKVGKWKNHFSDNLLEDVELQLRVFDLSLENFQLEPGNHTLN